MIRGDGLLVGGTFVAVSHERDGTVWIVTPAGHLDWISRSDARDAARALVEARLRRVRC